MSIKVSGAELELMEYLWECGADQTFADLLDFFNTHRQKSWCKQTLNTNLLRLKKKALLTTEKRERKTYYRPAVSRMRYEQMCAEEILQESYGGALSNFIAAFTGGSRITEEEKQRLQKYIEDKG